MNKTQISYIEHAAARVKSCLLGKIESDINSRLPDKPKELDRWEKYELIKSGAATVKDIGMKDIMSRYSNVDLINSFDYPESAELKTYEDAEKAISLEKQEREMAVELSLNRIVDECVIGIITVNEYLDNLEIMAQQNW